MKLFYLVSLLMWSTLAAAAPAKCPPGQQIGADTAGRCCWPGQAWAKSRNVCVGTPVCPAPMVAVGEQCGCAPGQEITADTAGQCCWAGQAWSNSRSRCVGTPTKCPAGLSSQPDGCVASAGPSPEPPPPPPPPPEAAPLPESFAAQPWPPSPNTRPTDSPPPPPPPPPPTPAPAEATASKPPPTPAPADATASKPPPTPAPEPVPTPGAPPDPVVVAPPAACPAETTPGWELASPAERQRLREACGAKPEVPFASTPTTLVGQQPDDRPRSKSPKRVRTSLILGGLGGEVLGGTVGVPIRIGLVFIKPGSPLQGAAALLIQPWLVIGFPPGRDTRFLNYIGGVTLAAGWEQRLGPIEVFPRFGVSTSLAFRNQGSTPFRLDLMFKGVAGLSLAVPAGERTRFLAGFDAHVGPENLYVGYVGVGF